MNVSPVIQELDRAREYCQSTMYEATSRLANLVQEELNRTNAFHRAIAVPQTIVCIESVLDRYKTMMPAIDSWRSIVENNQRALSEVIGWQSTALKRITEDIYRMANVYRNVWESNVWARVQDSMGGILKDAISSATTLNLKDLDFISIGKLLNGEDIEPFAVQPDGTIVCAHEVVNIEQVREIIESCIEPKIVKVVDVINTLVERVGNLKQPLLKQIAIGILIWLICSVLSVAFKPLVEDWAERFHHNRRNMMNEIRRTVGGRVLAGLKSMPGFRFVTVQ